MVLVGHTALDTDGHRGIPKQLSLASGCTMRVNVHHGSEQSTGSQAFFFYSLNYSRKTVPSNLLTKASSVC